MEFRVPLSQERPKTGIEYRDRDAADGVAMNADVWAGFAEDSSRAREQAVQRAQCLAEESLVEVEWLGRNPR